VVRFGWLQLTSRNAQGGDDVVAQLGPNELIGELSLLLPQACPFTVTALSPAELLELPRAAFEEIVCRKPALGLAVARSLAGRTELHLASLQKAAQWSQALAAGEWRTVLIDLEQLQGAGGTRGSGSTLDEELAAAFFDLAQRLRALSVAAEVRAATTAVHQFSIEIDEARRQEEVEKLAQRTFFGRLKSATVQFRRQREDGSQSSDADKG
jgi:CRP-like cAMP-binding protein